MVVGQKYGEVSSENMELVLNNDTETINVNKKTTVPTFLVVPMFTLCG